jgi:hypothetical protein
MVFPIAANLDVLLASLDMFFGDSLGRSETPRKQTRIELRHDSLLAEYEYSHRTHSAQS